MNLRVLEEDMPSEFWKDNDMTDFKSLTYEEIREIDDDEAIDAIEVAIRAQLSTGDYYELTDKEDASDLRAQVGDIIIRFRPRFCWEWADAAICEEYSTEEREAMTGEERSELEQDAFREIVIQTIDQGVARNIWQDLCDRARHRAQSNPYYDTRESRAACNERHAA